jgi:pimeloyl-ACP methyl ester carboxylesterase
MQPAARLVAALAVCAMASACGRAAPGPSSAAAAADDSDPEAIRALAGYAASYLVEPEFGARVRLLEVGPIDGPPVLLVHGLGEQGMRDFFPVLPAMARAHRVLALDLPGFGRSTRAAERYTPDRYVRSIHAIARAKIGRPFDLVGHSMGGAIAISYAAAHPADVSRLIVIDAAGILNKDALPALAISAGLGTLPSFLERVRDVAGALGTSLSTPLVDLAPNPRVLLDDDTARRAILARPDRIAALALALHDHGSAIAAVEAPTLLVWGERDAIAPMRTAEVLRARLRNARLVVLPNAGHEPILTEPSATARYIVEHIDTPIERLRRPVQRPTAGVVPIGRTGSCNGQRGVTFEGDYTDIEIAGCVDVVLRNVRVARLVVRESEVVVSGGRVAGPGVAVSAASSRLTMTATDIAGDIGIDTDRSDLDLAGVNIVGGRAAVRATGSTRIVFSVSRIESSRGSALVHETRGMRRGDEL